MITTQEIFLLDLLDWDERFARKHGSGPSLVCIDPEKPLKNLGTLMFKNCTAIRTIPDLFNASIPKQVRSPNP
jgi:hypothetical protein